MVAIEKQTNVICNDKIYGKWNSPLEKLSLNDIAKALKCWALAFFSIENIMIIEDKRTITGVLYITSKQESLV